MADIEFEEVIGQIEDNVETAGDRYRDADAAMSESRLRRLIREEAQTRAHRAQRLEP